ncbi:MAG: hypothetical protein J5614_00535 [Paludibacteraceae bacterium]|nr:hypothetical protein [Paludibacteraceae bacterium]
MGAPLIHMFHEENVTQDYIDKIEKATPEDMTDVIYRLEKCKNIDLLRFKRETEIQECKFKELYIDGPEINDPFFNIKKAPEVRISASTIFHVYGGVSTLVAIGSDNAARSNVKHAELCGFGYVEDADIERLQTYYMSVVKLGFGSHIDTLDCSGGGTVIVLDIKCVGKIKLGGGSSVHILTTEDSQMKEIEKLLPNMLESDPRRPVFVEQLSDGSCPASVLLHG